ncbi:MAG: nicotinic acid mononucleotide adenylyltransferase [SAR86 cluster bacterium]|uniref:Probable nicotinate-nucleotide adenylyltransferase n=1 Tax=SAR86 cluster bacterium TaxID=2030880 RepID=A0A2A5CD97_9GAMM|nr:nicotinate-nucleotide adenylyltransferase [Gammaproteobacteria bacterium AH-315-E17]PCJ41508.1 MAG: nicotinic acid mononucleotide adenylyltransferase [SAR86 cluster bacterium]
MAIPEKKNIGILGGTFDPVHFGHLRTALAAQQDFSLDEVRLIPCHHPVHKEEPEVLAQHRIAMLHKATRAEKRLVVDVRECMRPGPSYMIETLESLRTEYPDDRLFLLLGADAFNKLEGWKDWQKLFELAHIITVTRPGWEINPSPLIKEYCEQRTVSSFSEMCEAQTGKVLPYSFMPLMIASSDIRLLLKENKSVRYLTPNKVIKYIKKHKLYT